MFCQNMLSQVRRSQPSRQPSPKMPDLHAKQEKQIGPVCTILGTMHGARKVTHKQIGDMDLAGFGDQHTAVYSLVSYAFLSYLHPSQYR